MAPKKQETSRTTASSSHPSERLVLSQTLSKLSSTQEAFAKAVEQMKEYTVDTVKGLDLEIESKRDTLNELEVQYGITLKNEQIKLKQNLDEFSYSAAVEIVKGRGESVINSDELKSLRDSVKKMAQLHAEELKALEDRERKSASIALHSAIANAELKHKAEVATITAENSQSIQQVKSLHIQINSMKEDIVAQRELTRQVAESSRAAPVQQSFGKQ